MKRRNPKSLQKEIETKSNRRAKAKALYELGAFHDNNSREALAIPNYRKAIRFGLDKKHEAMTRVWLASSLYKTGNLKLALKECKRALELAKNERLQKFVQRLQRRIHSQLNGK